MFAAASLMCARRGYRSAPLPHVSGIWTSRLGIDGSTPD
jgi:hypothetical protein